MQGLGLAQILNGGLCGLCGLCKVNHLLDLPKEVFLRLCVHQNPNRGWGSK